VPHFRVDDGLHSHPKARQAGLEAMGLWNMCGSYCMGYLTDGFVPEWYVKSWPKGAALAKRLVAAKLWTPAVGEDGEKGWQFHEFTGPGRNDSRAQVEEARTKWRDKKAGQRRESPGDSSGVSPGDRPARSGTESAGMVSRKHDTKGDTTGKSTPDPVQNQHDLDTWDAKGENRFTSGDLEMSPGDTPHSSPRDSLRVTRDPTQPNKEQDFGYVSESATEPNGRDSIAATPGAELVREIIPPGHPAATLTLLRIRSGELLRQGHSRADVAAALELWLAKPNLGPNALPSLLSEVIKSRAAPNGGQPTSKMRALAELANEVRAAEQAQIEAGRKELT